MAGLETAGQGRRAWHYHGSDKPILVVLHCTHFFFKIAFNKDLFHHPQLAF